MHATEINFDGLIGPIHNYAGLSVGNLASATNAGGVSRPRDAALQGLAKMRVLMDRGLTQGFIPPPRRPGVAILRSLGFGGSDAEVLTAAAESDPVLFNNACSASSMWAANAATVLAAPDCDDGRVHLVTANLATMLHRSFEATATHAMLSTIFADRRHFAVHSALPATAQFSDEGAANHMRLSTSHAAAGANVFVHGEPRGGRFPERQSRRAGEAVARMAGVGVAIHTLQSRDAIEAGAFHNDVVAVANENVLFAHPQAFEGRDALFAALSASVPGFVAVETAGVTLAEAVSSYLFNSQLVTLPTGAMALVLPAETQTVPSVRSAIDAAISGDNPIVAAIIVDVRESMRNGGGPACLRLRVPVSEAAKSAIDQRFLLTPARWDALASLVEAHWPETIDAGDLTDPAIWAEVGRAHDALSDWLRSS
ncbi:N-succinylarginine dihydrolase [Sphingomonas montanisoli]|uniref:N-succinylarginine dihydrolase n=1 Tax=Sphingomonas montanisoli TaxID=2606412 RepID=A0A5D9CBD1_9SPHN|nr:N-succinylarginine dihydrolase [Sphingomonas montanisoli]TZG28607.1 N-succinylarginine dihydrolase [Sphingomonas montanisoli]